MKRALLLLPVILVAMVAYLAVREEAGRRTEPEPEEAPAEIARTEPRRVPDAPAPVVPGAQGPVLHGVVRGPEGAAPGVRILAGGRTVATTGAGGRYQAVLRPGAVDVVAEPPPHGGLARSERKGVALPARGEVRVDFDLAEGLAIAGRVEDGAGAPVAALRVAVAAEARVAGATTDREGRFRFPGVAPGTYSLVSEADAWLVHPAVEAAAGATDVRAVVVPSVRVRLVVRDALTGVPVRDVVVSAGGLVLHGPDGVAEGRLPRGEIAVDAPGYETVRIEPEGEVLAEDLLVHGGSARNVAVVARYEDGAPYERALRGYYRGEDANARGRLDLRAAGRGRFDGRAPPGAWTLVFELPDYRGATSGSLRAEIPLDGVYEAQVEIPPGATLVLLCAAEDVAKWQAVPAYGPSLRGRETAPGVLRFEPGDPSGQPGFPVRGPTTVYENLVPGVWTLVFPGQGSQVDLEAGRTREVTLPRR